MIRHAKVSGLWTDYTQAGALHRLVPIQSAVDEQTLFTKRGHLLAVLSTEGVDYECLDPDQLERIVRRFEAATRSLGEDFVLRQYLIKTAQPSIPARTYTNPVIQQASADRVADLKARANRLYRLNIYLVVIYAGWRPAGSGRAGFTQWASDPKTAFRSWFSTAANVKRLQTDVERASAILRETVDSLIAQLEDVLPFTVLKKPEAFRFVRRLLNYSPLKAQVGGLKYDTFVDFFACDSALECHRDHLRVDDYYVRVLSLKEATAHSFPHLLRGLVELPANAIITTEWKREPNATMRRLIQSKRRHFHHTKTSVLSDLTSNAQTSSNDRLVDAGAVALVDDLGGGLEELEVKNRHFGQFVLTIVLYDFDRAAVERAQAECVKLFATHDGCLIEERYNQLNAWLGVLPGNEVYNLRRLYLLNTNYADLSFLFGQRIGEPINSHLNAEYLAVLETEGATPYFLNLHYQDVAHTLILGATGSGKSFFANFLITFLQKYDPVTVLFDLGGGYRSVTRLFGGTYAAIGVGAQGLSINPFSLASTPENRHFLASFVRVLVESGGYRMTSADERDLSDQIETLYAVDPDQRRLLTLANIVNRTLRLQLHKWVGDGPFARWFDNAVDSGITLARFQAFDFEGMAKYPEVLEALVFYILHRANSLIYDPALASTFKVFVLDEAWRFFRHPVIRQYIIEALKTFRKRNAAMLLATQSVDDLRQSELLPVIVESCATQFFLANPGMDRDLYREIFHLNATEIDRIAGLIPKKQLLIKRPDLAKVLNLNVDRKGYWLFTTSPADIARKEPVLAQHGLATGLDILARSDS